VGRQGSPEFCLDCGGGHESHFVCDCGEPWECLAQSRLECINNLRVRIERLEATAPKGAITGFRTLSELIR
jgi:hypothetical protein